MTIYEGPGRGRKQCSACGTYTHVRQKKCPSCDASFEPKSGPASSSKPVIIPVPRTSENVEAKLAAGIKPFAKPSEAEVKSANVPKVARELPTPSRERKESKEPRERAVSSQEYSHVDELNNLKTKLARELRLLSRDYARGFIAEIWSDVFGDKLVTKDDYLFQRAERSGKEQEKPVPPSLEVDPGELLEFIADDSREE